MTILQLGRGVVIIITALCVNKAWGIQLTAVTSFCRHLDETLVLLLELRGEVKDINDTSWWEDFVDGGFVVFCRCRDSRNVPSKEFRNNQMCVDWLGLAPIRWSRRQS